MKIIVLVLSLLLSTFLQAESRHLPRLYTIEGDVKKIEQNYATIEYKPGHFIKIEKQWIKNKPIQMHKKVQAEMTFNEIDLAPKYRKLPRKPANK